MIRLIILRGCDPDSNYSSISEKKCNSSRGRKSTCFNLPLIIPESLARCLRKSFKLFLHCLLKNPLTPWTKHSPVCNVGVCRSSGTNASLVTVNVRFPPSFCRLYLVSELLHRLLQGQYLVEEGTLEHRLEQAELLLGGHLPPLLQFGLEALHRLQGTLRICKPSHISVAWWSGCREEDERWVR